MGWLIGLGMGLIVAFILYRRKYHQALMQGKFERDKAMLKKYRNYALWAFIGINVGTLFGQMIQQLVLYFLGAEAAGYYANFLSLFGMGGLVIAPIMSLIMPLISEHIEKKEKEKIQTFI